MTLAVEQINGTGGVLGRPLTLLFEDTQGSPQAGLAAVGKLLRERVHVFAGEFHSVVADAIVEPVERSSLPFLCASATMDSVTARRLSMVFRLAPPQSYGWSVYADCLASHGFQHVVALQEDNLYWNSGSRVMEARLHNLGVRFTRLPLTAGSTDVVACIRQVQGMRSEHPAPDILLMLVAYPEPFVSLASEASRHGLVPPACFIGDPAGRVACQDRWGVAGTDAMRVPFLSYLRLEQLTEEGQRLSRSSRAGLGVNRLLSRTKDTTASLSSRTLAQTQGPSTREPYAIPFGKSRYSARAAPSGSRRSLMAWCINSGNGRRCASSLTVDRSNLFGKLTCYGTRSMAAQVECVFCA
jgi:hypothetical protein